MELPDGGQNVGGGRRRNTLQKHRRLCRQVAVAQLSCSVEPLTSNARRTRVGYLHYVQCQEGVVGIPCFARDLPTFVKGFDIVRYHSMIRSRLQANARRSCVVVCLIRTVVVAGTYQ